ncbi:MAG TPA: hypothetical protein PLI45_01125 [Candidatus Woesebacteria bacterium]|nr:hypothetical protein [Candidatus Woesebacteria bacterium]
MAKRILIVHADHTMQFHMQAYGERLTDDGYSVAEMHFLTGEPIKDRVKILADILAGKPQDNVKYDLVIIFDNYETILKKIRNLKPFAIPVFYVDIFREVSPIEGFTWFQDPMPSELSEEAKKVLS